MVHKYGETLWLITIVNHYIINDYMVNNYD